MNAKVLCFLLLVASASCTFLPLIKHKLVTQVIQNYPSGVPTGIPSGRTDIQSPTQPPSRPPNQPPSRLPNQPPSRLPNQPPNRPPNQPPSRLPNQPPSRPPNQPPNQPHSRPPNRPPNQQPNQQPNQPPNQPPDQQPNQPPNQQPSRPPNQPPNQQPRRPPNKPPSRPPQHLGSSTQALPNLLNDFVNDIVYPLSQIKCNIGEIIGDIRDWSTNLWNLHNTSPSDASTTEAPSTSTTAATTTTAASSTTAGTSTTAASTTDTDKPNQHSRKTRDISDDDSDMFDQSGLSQLLNNVPIKNLTSLLSQIDFSKVKSVPKITLPSEISQSMLIPGLRETIAYARNMTVQALDGTSDLQKTIQSATEKAIHSMDPVGGLISMILKILHAYQQVVMSCPVHIVAAAVIEDGLLVISAVIRSIVAASALG